MKRNLGEAPLPLGGWLVLIGIRLFLGIIANGDSLLRSLLLPLSTPTQILRLLSILVYMYSFVVLTWFCKRHKAFPVAYIILECCVIILTLFSFILLAAASSIIERHAFVILQTVIPIIIGSLWILYIRRSRRVKSTFVFIWHEKPDQRLIDRANKSAQT